MSTSFRYVSPHYNNSYRFPEVLYLLETDPPSCSSSPSPLLAPIHNPRVHPRPHRRSRDGANANANANANHPAASPSGPAPANPLSALRLEQPQGLPEGYQMRATEQGQLYFLHAATGQSTWHDPRVPRHVPLRELIGDGEENELKWALISEVCASILSKC